MKNKSFCLIIFFGLIANLFFSNIAFGQIYDIITCDSIYNQKAYYTIEKKAINITIEPQTTIENCKLYYCPKTKTAFFFEQIYDQLPIKCNVKQIFNNQIQDLKPLSVAAYTKEKDQNRMNYNSILPYISIAKAIDRTIISFECEFIVLNVDSIHEKIEKSSQLYGIITQKEIELKKY